MEKDSPDATLQSELESLRCRVKELEIENAKLSSQLEHCRFKVDEKNRSKGGNDVVFVQQSKQLQRTRTTQGHDVRVLHHHPKRYVALKIMYFGQRFYGFSSEAQTEPTVESELFKAFEKTRLLVGDKKESQYSRCGRTDKGVSASGQVIALFLRSKLKAMDQSDADSTEGEIDYVRLLNKALPREIRILGWCPVPEDFHARFTCLSREYKYFFWREDLDISAMENAGKKFLGEHDFRNFCKMDAVNVHNYKRHVTSFEISSFSRFEDRELCAIKITGSAFLWHQVRCMVAILFLIGQRLESIDVIDVLLDIKRMPRKPQYAMASEIPLVLQSCEFEGLKFFISPDAQKALYVHLDNEWKTQMLHSAIFQQALKSCSSIEKDEQNRERDLFKGKMRHRSSHVLLMARPTEPSYEERRAKLNAGH